MSIMWKNCLAKSIISISLLLPYYVDMSSRMIVTHGIEIEDLMALPIPRKTYAQDLKLESYQFVPNEDSIAIEESDRKQNLEYIKVYIKVLISK